MVKDKPIMNESINYKINYYFGRNLIKETPWKVESISDLIVLCERQKISDFTLYSLADINIKYTSGKYESLTMEGFLKRYKA